jgi:C-terminal processing protease CtpA/Prc
MLYELKDEHTNLITRFNISHNPEVFLDYPENFFSEILTRNYFNGRQQRIDQTFSLFDFGDVIYVRYSSFEDNISDYAMNYIIDKTKDKKGLIIDVRNNGGGSITNIDILCSRLMKENTSMGIERHKSGKGKNDFSEEKVSVSVDANAKKFLDKPLMILTNRGCYSATNRFAAYMKGLPNVTLVGDVTGGGGGLPTATELSNGWVLRVSGSQFIDRRGDNIENGVKPDVKIDILKSDIDKGKDTILEKALSLIRK